MNFNIHQYPVNHALEPTLIKHHREYLNWPLIYFLEEKGKEKREAYVGETADVLTRLKTHSKSERKQNLRFVNLILSDFFNKSAALDIESNLIRYIAADGHYVLQNGNLGIADHQYYQQKEVYQTLFRDIWSELRSMKIARHSLEHINNSDVFKYSPYKSLSKEQVRGLKIILNCLLDENAKVSLIEGGAGTGKSILAIFLFKLLKTDLQDFNHLDFDEDDQELFSLLKKVKEKYDNLNMALVIPMASFRKTISKVFKGIKGLTSKMVIGPSDMVKQEYDLLIVDEGHRLRRRVNLGSYYRTFDKNSEILGLDKMTSSELDWVQIQSKKAIIFYDELQTIKPSDVARERFYELKDQPATRKEKLTVQLRIRGGNEYVKLVHQLFDDSKKHKSQIKNTSLYDFKLFDNLDDMVEQIRIKDQQKGLSRMVAGFAWEWVSKKDKSLFDIQIGHTLLKWNSTEKDWINSKNAIKEVGCIHTTQGYDLNYTGVIIGPELDYDFTTNQFVVYKERYKDKNGKNSIKDNRVLLDYILNIYRTLLLRGMEGTYVYVCNPNLRKYFAQFIPANDRTEEHKPTYTIVHKPNEFTVPYYDLEIAAGSFSDQQSVENVTYIELPDLRQNGDHFVCKVVGESMNKIIPNGSLCLFKKYTGGSRNGLITLVDGSEIHDTDSGANYTIKEYSSKKSADEEGWYHEEIILRPLSTEPYEPIVLRDDEIMNFQVIGIFVRVLE